MKQKTLETPISANSQFLISGGHPTGDAILDSCRHSETGEAGNSASFRTQGVRYHGEDTKIRRRCQNVGEVGRRGAR